MTIFDFFNIPQQGREFLLDPKGKSQQFSSELVDKIFISPITILGALSIASGGMYLATRHGFLLLPFFVFVIPLFIFIGIYLFARIIVRKVIEKTSRFAEGKFSAFNSGFPTAQNRNTRMKKEENIIDVEITNDDLRN